MKMIMGMMRYEFRSSMVVVSSSLLLLIITCFHLIICLNVKSVNGYQVMNENKNENGNFVNLHSSRNTQEKSVRIISSSTSLRRKNKKSFKIGLFADLHYGENGWSDWGPTQDFNSDKVMSTVLDLELPDFVIYLGDVVTANNIATKNASLYWDKAISPTRDRGIPWASLFGNHDDASFEWPIDWFSATGIPPLQCSNDCPHSEDKCSFKSTPRLELMKNEIKHNKLSFSKNGPRNLWPSVSNYVLQVSSSDGRNQPIAFLYFLDSGGGSYPQVISSAQAKWFQNQSQEINPDSSIPELIFWHIPSKAYEEAGQKFGIDKSCVGSINKEKVAPQEAEMGIMKLLVNRPSVKAVFVGHNHGLDWCCPYEKLWLCFARHTGYGGYGDWPRGARIIEINQQPDFSIKSWIRMENGDTHSHVVLS